MEEAQIAKDNAQTELRYSAENNDITLDINHETEGTGRDQSSLLEYLKILYRNPQFKIYLLDKKVRFKNLENEMYKPHREEYIGEKLVFFAMHYEN